jgi:YggT family protein
VNPVITAIDALLGVLRVAFFVMALALAVISTIDWLVRTRRINPFSRVARFFRQSIDPVFAPVERRLVRAGGLPTAAPWWTLAAVVIGAILILSLLGFVRDQFVSVAVASETGVRGLIRLLVLWAFQLLQIAILVRVISSWISVSPYSKWVRWSYTLSEPILRPLRSVIPTFGAIDVTPIVAFFGLRILQSLILGVL